MSGLVELSSSIRLWRPDSPLEEISEIWRGAADREIKAVDARFADVDPHSDSHLRLLIRKALLLNSEAEAAQAYKVLKESETVAGLNRRVARR